MPESFNLPDGRRLDLFLDGPAEGLPVLFHHGSPGSGLPDPAFVGALAGRGLRYVAWSRPGYGDSTRRPGRLVADVVDDATAVLDHLGAARAYTFGWSGGGPHAMATAAALPDRILGATTVGGVAPYPADGIDWFEGMGPENIEEFGASLEGPEALLVFKERAWPVFRDVTGEEMADALGGLIDEVDRGSLTGAFAESLAASTREGLRTNYWGWFDDDMAFNRDWGFDIGSIRVPVHIWQGGHDRMVPYTHGRWLAGRVGAACPHLHPDHGHLTLVVDTIGPILDEMLR
ncbi:MAG TPA: alpha/beta hydrolase [Candidatus Limnocylindria bacterium]|nr:alpha/beta hydrolase [Candidatus Limnocylindria bacterium]